MDTPRPRDEALEPELTSLLEQEADGHGTAKEHRRAEQIERRLHADAHGAHLDQAREDRAAEREEDDAERDRHKRHPGSG